ncbi:MAG: SHOCT-like domain-containing protein [Caulobacteraceae bacterium]
MSGDRNKILNMLAEGKITAEEAERLLDALDSRPSGETQADPTAPKYLRVQVEKARGDERDPKHVNIRVPLSLLRAGVRLQGIIPPKARASLNAALAEKGVNVDLDKLKADQVESLIKGLAQTSIDIDADDGKSRVKVSCE